MPNPTAPQPSNPSATTHLIIVMGVSGSGKSTLAQALASHYGFEYLDGDDFHSADARAHMAQGLPLDDAMRQPWVERMRQHFSSAARTGSHATLAFSGLKRTHRDELRKAGMKTLFLFLHSDQHTIQQRVNNRSGHFMAPSLVTSQFASLERPQLEEDVVELDVSGTSAEVTAHAIAIIDQYLLTPSLAQPA